MNAPFVPADLRSPELPVTTQAAEGLLRRRWTVAEIEAMVETGIVGEHERFELIGGEIVPMNAKGIHHEILKAALMYHFVRNTPDEFRFAAETTLRLGEDSFIEPDFIFFRKSVGLADLNPQTALLAIELADSSLRWDLGRKAGIYADFGIPELWVIEAVPRLTHIHTRPGPAGYGDIRRCAANQALRSLSIGGLSLTLADIETF